MWLLENEGDALEGKQLWLRPGKRYLFGRTVAEPGQLAIKGEGAERVSRKHVTIQVDEVKEGDGENVLSRSRVTVKDLGSKGGTWVNDDKIKGEARVLSKDTNVIQMGSFASKFKITWNPVVLSFSFSAKELQADPVSRLREDLEQLDIKFLADYDPSTTHVVTRKRNVPKALQALVNARYVVSPEFYGTIITAATPEEGSDGVATSALESDFKANWPDEMQFVPPAGDEPVPRPVETFYPNKDRIDMFHGYTFIFYNKKQYDHLLGPITSGGGKASLFEAIERQTDPDEFIRHAKGIAGEKGLGEFEDGSEGKGVVVVRWIPDPPRQWFVDFHETVSQMLDQRFIETKEILDVILNNDTSRLRRALQIETSSRRSQPEPQTSTGPEAMEIDGSEDPGPQKPPPRRRERGPIKSRFKGFVVDLSDDDDLPKATPPATAPVEENEESQGLFVSQPAPPEEPEEVAPPARQSQRKRRAPPPESHGTIDDFAPTAAQIKRRRIAAGEDPVPRASTPVESFTKEPQKPKTKSPTVKKEIDILDLARQRREEVEARAKAEREELATAPEDLDLAEIRRLHIEEPMEIRQVSSLVRTREQDIADGRWDPTWSGRKNFKKFRERDGPQRRPPQRIIVSLEEVKTKGFGIGDDYWLEDESQQRRKKKGSQTQSQGQGAPEKEDRRKTKERETESDKQKRKMIEKVLAPVDSSDDGDQNMDDEEEEEDVVEAPPPKTRTTRASQQTSQSQTPRTTSRNTTQKTQSSRASKRSAPPPAKEQPAKRARIGFVADSDDESDDGLRFRFGKR
ncbi:hypothetical protein M426DRAFT_324072 [Hypoxylon sp. CI-4A]|nr:hypothetical protein M426DRAFT_324072 [Hypoxylon sp. CI-4A]